jgi:long-chain acyl-CoA synthetase
MNSLADYIEHLATEFDSQTAITYYHRFRSTSYTYRELYQLALKCSAFFLEKGLIKGNCILIYGDNCPEWVVVLLSCALTGIVLVPIDSKSPKAFAEKIRFETQAKWIISDVPTKHPNIRLDDLFSLIEPYVSDFRRSHPVDGDDILEIIYTSGTTAAPKGAVIRHRNLIASIWGIRQQSLVCDKNSRFLSMLPLSHVLEQNGGCLSVLRFGGQIIYAKQVRFIRIIDIMIQEKITHIISVPAILNRFHNKIVEEFEARGKTSLLKRLLQLSRHLPIFLRRLLSLPVRQKIGSHLQAFICGGAPLNLNTETFWENLGIKVIQGYGLTESCAMSCVNTYKYRKKGSVGRPIPNQLLKLGEGNEILLRGENIISEYYNAPELNQEYFCDGWYRTGDVGRMDEEGNLYIVGRLKEMILTSNGLNVFPSDIEEILNNMPGIKESAVFEDPTNEGKLLAGIVMDIQEIDIKSTLEETNRQLAAHQQLSKLIPWFHSSFPKTNSLKIKRNELANIYQQLAKKHVITAPPDPLLQIIAEISKVPVADLHPETTLVKNLSLDSLNLVDLVIRLESQFRVDIDEAVLSQDCNLQQLRTLLTTTQKAPKPPAFHYGSWPIKALRRLFRIIIEHAILRRWIKIEVIGTIPEIPKTVLPFSLPIIPAI